jgi:hypothetical protein
MRPFLIAAAALALALLALSETPEAGIVIYAFALFVAFWVLLALIVVRPREPYVSAFVVVAFAGIALAAVLASTRVPQEAPKRAGVEVGFGYPIHFVYATSESHQVSEMHVDWESPRRIDLARFVLSYALVVVPLVGAYAAAIRRTRRAVLTPTPGPRPA